tara:strand:+ start:2810 stop:3019 length:210 start_codon:yes stop_codon:yes gene_type:complete
LRNPNSRLIIALTNRDNNTTLTTKKMTNQDAVTGFVTESDKLNKDRLWVAEILELLEGLAVKEQKTNNA